MVVCTSDDRTRRFAGLIKHRQKILLGVFRLGVHTDGDHDDSSLKKMTEMIFCF